MQSVGDSMTTADALLFALTLFAALGCGLMSGVFFAFSVCVMKALYRLVPSAGIAAMQSINVVIVNPLFLTVFVGTTAACVLLMIIALFSWHDPAAIYCSLAARCT
jgi:uncharacterized membrane protein